MTSLAATHTNVPVSDEDPFDDSILTDPYPFHERLRAAGPAVYLSRYDVYALGRYPEVRAALRDWQSFESGAGVGLINYRVQTPWQPPGALIEADPPRHDAPRVVLEKILGPRSLARLRSKWFTDAQNFVDAALATHGDEFDAAKELAQGFPLRVFPDAVGLPREGRENLLPYGDHAFNAFGPNNKRVAAGTTQIAERANWIDAQCQRDALTDDGFGAAIWSAADRGDIAERNAPLLIRALLVAGLDTTVHGLGAALYGLASFPEQWQALTRNSELAGTAFYEAVRWQSPIQTFFRTATRDVQVANVTVPEGRKILLFLGSANRDPDEWSVPEIFDLGRDPSGHVGFGAGIHQCVGQHVARLEAEALLAALTKRVATIEMSGQPVPHLNNTLRALESLPIRITRRK